VYSPDLQMVASTCSLLGARQLLVGAFPANRASQFYPDGLTHDPSIYRILPNHYLDLDAWKSHRHWPDHEMAIAEEERVPELIQAIVDRVTENIAAISRQYPTNMGLTRGRDSRMLLACAVARREIQFATFVYKKGRLTRVDKYMACKLSRRLDLNHKILPVARPSSVETQAYWRRIVYSVGYGKAADFNIACRRFGIEAAWINGFAGGVGKAVFWRSRDVSSTELTGSDLIDRMDLEHQPGFASALDSWLARLATTDALEALNFAYLEQNVGCWSSPHMYGGSQAHPISPFCHRDIVEAMLRLPARCRLRKQMAVDVVRRACPEISDLPYHSFQGWRRRFERVRNTPNAIRRRFTAAPQL